MVCEHSFADLPVDLTKPIFTDLEKLRREDFPTTQNTEFEVSDICDSRWEKEYRERSH